MCISLQQIGSYQTYCTKEELNRMKALKTPTSLKSLMSSKGSCFLLRLPLLLGRIPLDGCSVANEHLGIYRIYSILLKQYFKVSVSFGYCNWVCPCSVIGCIEVALCLFCRQFFTAKIFAKLLHNDPYGRISIMQFFNYVMRKG